MIRDRIPDDVAEYIPGKLGVNLRKGKHDLLPGEAELEQNCYWDSNLRKRFGAARFTTVSLGNYYGTGGHKAYFGTGSNRIVSYEIYLVSISDTGIISTLTSTMTSGNNTYFADWPITDRCYITNGAEVPRYVDASGALAQLTGGYIPATPTQVVAFNDRLFAIQGDVVVVTDPRTDAMWSPATSSWSAYRGIGGSGNPTAIAIHSGTGNSEGQPEGELLIFQRNTLSALRGTDFGSSVVAASPPSGYNATMQSLDPRIGTSSPYSVCNVPGVGTFWFTSERNVAWLPLGQSVPRIIGNSLYSYRSDIPGVNDTNRSALAQVVMKYHDLKLKLYLPIGGDTYSTIQYWLDLRPLMENMAAILTQPSENIPASWSGPHRGQSIRRAWIENQSGDPERLMGLEGNVNNGLMVYELNPENYSLDDVGVSTTSAIDYWFKGHYWTGGMPGYVKALYNTLIDSQGYINLATVTVNDLHATVTNGFTIQRLNGTAFTNVTYGNTAASLSVLTNLAAWYQFNTGITSAGGLVSQWNDQSGNARHLLQATGTNQPSLQGDGSILFDGVDNFLATGAITTIAQPTTWYILFRQVTWASNDVVFDSADRQILIQDTATPQLAIYAGTATVANNSDLAVNTYGALAVVYNGASSLVQVNNGTPTTGNPGAASTGTELYLGSAAGGGVQWSNIQVKEVLIYSAAHDATTRATVIQYLLDVQAGGTSFRYGTGTLYGANSANNMGHVNYSSRSAFTPSGDALQYEIRHSMGQHFGVNRILPQAKVEKRQPLHNI